MNSFVKITSGIYRGRRIKTPGEGTHPMGERERIALFNMISEALPDSLVLDAYAGSGALGIEAISRDAGRIVFLEKNASAMRTIRENCRELEINNDKTEFYLGPVGKFSDEVLFRGEFDIILADPPYDKYKSGEIEKLANSCLKAGGILVLSHPGEAPEISKLEILKTKQYARAHLTIYCKK